MPIQQITVVPARDSGTGKGSTRSKDKSESKKGPGRSGSRSSNISKVSNSTGLTTTSRTSVTPSSQDICSPLSRLEEEESELQNSGKHTNSSTMTVTSALGSSTTASGPKKQVKRRHRRKKTSCSSCECVDSNSRQDHTDHSSDRSEKGERKEHIFKTKKDLAPRLRCSGAPQTNSSSDEESWRQARSWSKEKARRTRRRSGSSRERESNTVQAFKVEEMELQSIGSGDDKENQPVEEDSSGLKRRHGSRASLQREVSEVRETSLSKDREVRSHSQGGGSSTPPTEEEKPEEITKRYQERGAGNGDMSVPTSQAHCTGNGATTLHPCSESETEVCRICHCEGDDECPLIMPCRCTGSLSFVHQTCLNQWIKSSDTRCCELCKFDFIMETKLKPLRKWEKLHMSKSERRKIFCSVLFHLIAIGCMLWSVYILVKRTSEEVRLGKNDLWRVSLLKYYTPEGVLEWPFWTKLIVVAIGFTGGLIFMYIQSKVYLQLWHRLKAFNRIITVQNCPDKELHNPQARRGASNHSQSVEVPLSPAPVSTHTHMDSDMSVEAAVAPAHSPV